MVVRSHILRFMLVALIITVPATLFAGPGAKAIGGGSQIEWQLPGGYERALLSVSTPSGEVISREIVSGKAVAFSLSELALVEEGSYTYQITMVQRIPAHVQK